MSLDALSNALKVALHEARTKEPETPPAAAAPTYDWPRSWFLPSSDAYGNDKDHVSA